MALKNVAVAGASGAVGTPIIEKLLSAGTFNITVLRRAGSSSSTSYPDSVKIVDADFDSVDSLTSALKGQDALVSAVGAPAILSQKTLIDAAAAAGVRRFLPSEYGSNLHHPKVRKLPVFAHQVEIQEYLAEKANTTDLTYTLVFNNAFLDWGLEFSFIINVKDRKPTIWDGGDVVFSSTTLGTVADAVVGVLRHPDETTNRAVKVKDVDTSQNQLLALAKKAAGTGDEGWQITNAKLADAVARSNERLAQGLLDFETFAPYLFQSHFDASFEPKFEETDNELLGIKGKTEEELFELVKKYVK